MAPKVKDKPSDTAHTSTLIDDYQRRDVWALLVGLRILNAALLATFFQPDEFYQALEPAWALAFGNPHDSPVDGPWITWEWRKGIRSSIYPVVLAGVYKAVDMLLNLLHFSPVSKAKLLIALPKIAPALTAAAMDYYTWCLGEKVFGRRSPESYAALALTVLSPWQWFCATRTLSNCAETALTVAAFYYWPWQWIRAAPGDVSRARAIDTLKYSILLGATAVMLRPTNILIWVVLSVYTLARATRAEAMQLVSTTAIYGTGVFALSQACDYFYYGAWSFPQLAWIVYNYSFKIGDFYGKNRIDYYFTEGIPLLLTTALPFGLFGIAQALVGSYEVTNTSIASPKVLRPFAAICLSFPLAMSLISHKEVRFIYPIFPLLIVLAAGPVAGYFAPFPYPRSSFRKGVRLAFIFTNIAVAAYVSLFHQRGVIDVMSFLRSEFEARNPHLATTAVGMSGGGVGVAGTNNSRLVAGFFMPCHSTPWRSHLHYPDLRAWALTCEPPQDEDTKALLPPDDEDRLEYRDEADQLYDDSPGFIRKQMATRQKYWPEYLVFFEQLEKTLNEVIVEKLYKECWRGFNSRFNPDWRRQGDVIVWCKDKNPSDPWGADFADPEARDK